MLTTDFSKPNLLRICTGINREFNKTVKMLINSLYKGCIPYEEMALSCSYTVSCLLNRLHICTKAILQLHMF